MRLDFSTVIDEVYARKIGALIKRRYAPYACVDAEWLTRWLSWYVREDRLAVVTVEGRFVGLGLARCLEHKEDWRNPWAHDEGGMYGWIDLVVCPVAEDMFRLWQEFLKRFGLPLEVGWTRRLKHNRVHWYEPMRLERHLRRTVYGRCTSTT